MPPNSCSFNYVTFTSVVLGLLSAPFFGDAVVIPSNSTLLPAVQSAAASLNITAFLGRDCSRGQLNNGSVLVPAGRCHPEYPPPPKNSSDPFANPVPNGYTSCCIYWGATFGSVEVKYSDSDAFANCSLTKFADYDCFYGTDVGPLDESESCMNTFYSSGAEGAPSNHERALAVRIDCVTDHAAPSATTTKPVTSTTTQATSSSVFIGTTESIHRWIVDVTETGVYTYSNQVGTTWNVQTITGPFSGYLTAKEQIVIGPLPSDCHSSARPQVTHESQLAQRLVTYVSMLEPVKGNITTTITLRDRGDILAPLRYFTATGPTTVYATITGELKAGHDGARNLYKLEQPDYCQGQCGSCSIYFPFVDVFYWPVASMNTACLGNQTKPATTSQTSIPPDNLRLRQLSPRDAAAGTLVSDGYT